MTPSPMAEVIFVALAGLVAAWVMSYLLHSTVVFGVASVATQAGTFTPADRARIWRLVLLLPFVSASVTALGMSDAMPLTLDLSRYAPQAFVDWRVGIASLLPVLMLPFILIAGVLSGLRMLRHAFGRRRPAPRAFQDEAAMLAMVVGCRIPRVTVSESADVPAAIGLSEICVPASLGDSAPIEEQRALIAHEMSHLVRRDPFWFMVAGSLMRVTAFQPLNRIALTKLRAACEEAADDMAVEATGDPAALARGLARLATMLVAISGGAAASGSPVVERVGRLLNESPRRRPWRRSTSMALAAASLVALVWLGPGVSANAESVADRLAWLGASKEEPNARMLEVRRITREWRDAINRAF